jgi:hypothetical protein
VVKCLFCKSEALSSKSQFHIYKYPKSKSPLSLRISETEDSGSRKSKDLALAFGNSSDPCNEIHSTRGIKYGVCV